MKILLFFASVISAVQCRKYDLEMEAMKLYGEDVNSVLLRFRKTPEYLNILNDKVLQLQGQLSTMGTHVQKYFERVLESKAIEVLGHHNNETIDMTSMYIRNHRALRQFDRDDNEKTPAKTRLDDYVKERQGLPTERVNFFKEMGFEYAGYVIHTVIRNMESDDSPGQSTQLPYGGDHQDHGKTEHPSTDHHEHQVTSSTERGFPDFVDLPSTAEAYRYRPK